MTTIQQKFNPPLRLCPYNEKAIHIIKSRKWETEIKDALDENSQDMGYIGQMQIEEVWKHYYKEYYISNYGYIVKISKKDTEIIPQELQNANEKSEGMCWNDFSKEVKEIFRHNAFIPKNRVNSRCQICLNITGKTAEYDIHKLVARFFLEKPKDYNDVQYVVHHIDNNSYNNSVTNLIYIPRNEHSKRAIHPLSKKQ